LLQKLAELHQKAGHSLEAARLMSQMADSEPDEGERFRLLTDAAQALLLGGDAVNAELALEKALALRPGDRAARSLLIDALAGAGKVDQGAELLAALLADAKTMRSEELAVLYQRQSRLAAARGNADEQLQSLKKAADTDRKSVVIAAELADLAESIGDDDLAMKALRVVAASPVKGPLPTAVAYLRQAKIALKHKDKSRAIIFVKRALQEDAQLEEARALLDELK